MMWLEEIEKHRPHLFSRAYQMLASIEDAEDVLQDVFIKLHDRDFSIVDNHKAYLVQIVTRLCLDKLKVLKKERSLYEGPWLPEPPVGVDEEEFPDRRLLSIAFLKLLEVLNPTERAIYLLRESFDHSYEDIALILQKTPENCRQILSRSKKKLREQSHYAEAYSAGTKILLEKLIEFSQRGEYEKLKRIMTDQVTLVADAGGQLKGAARKKLNGKENVLKFIFGVRTNNALSIERYEVVHLNNVPIILARSGQKIVFTIWVVMKNGLISSLAVLANPAKLKHLEIRLRSMKGNE